MFYEFSNKRVQECMFSFCIFLYWSHWIELSVSARIGISPCAESRYSSFLWRILVVSTILTDLRGPSNDLLSSQDWLRSVKVLVFSVRDHFLLIGLMVLIQNDNLSSTRSFSPLWIYSTHSKWQSFLHTIIFSSLNRWRSFYVTVFLPHDQFPLIELKVLNQSFSSPHDHFLLFILKELNQSSTRTFALHWNEMLNPSVFSFLCEDLSIVLYLQDRNEVSVLSPHGPWYLTVQ